MIDVKHDLIPSKRIQELDSNSFDKEFDAEKEKNQLLCQSITEKIQRDIQRKEHRDTVFTGILVVCFVFYSIFISLVIKLYCDVQTLRDIPASWVLPLMGLITVPTLLLVVVMMCIYRHEVNVGVGNVIQAAEKMIATRP